MRAHVQVRTRAVVLLSTSDRPITLPAKRWTPPVIGQLIVRLDVCTLAESLANTTAPSAHSYCPIHSHRCSGLILGCEVVDSRSGGPNKRNMLMHVLFFQDCIMGGWLSFQPADCVYVSSVD